MPCNLSPSRWSHMAHLELGSGTPNAKPRAGLWTISESQPDLGTADAQWHARSSERPPIKAQPSYTQSMHQAIPWHRNRVSEDTRIASRGGDDNTKEMQKQASKQQQRWRRRMRIGYMYRIRLVGASARGGSLSTPAQWSCEEHRPRPCDRQSGMGFFWEGRRASTRAPRPLMV